MYPFPETENADVPLLKAQNKPLNLSPETWGWLRDSSDLTGDLSDPSAGDALRARMNEDGYLFLPGLLDRARVIDARREITRRLGYANALAPNTNPMDALAPPKGQASYFRPDLSENNHWLHDVLYRGKMIEFFGLLFGEAAHAVRPFDFTWLRAVSPGGGTAPHCDIVYMGRGTHELVTAWTPLGDIDLLTGGLFVLEGSHKKRALLGDYTHRDVDSFCENGPNKDAILSGKLHWEKGDGSGDGWDGAISHDPVAIQAALGGRFLSCRNYHMGDVLVFSPFTVHASLDNQSNRVRLSSDTRYQKASEPIDERWINGAQGEKPIGHGLAAKKGRIC